MPMQPRKKFTGNPLKLPQLNTSEAMAIDSAYSPGTLLRRSCFEGPLTPLSSEGDYDVAFDTIAVTDVSIDQNAYSRLKGICFEDPLTPLSPEGDSFDSLDSLSGSDVSTDQIPIRFPQNRSLVVSRPDKRPPPALTREETYETFDEPLTPLGSGMETGMEKSKFVTSASRALPTSNGYNDAYIKPQASIFDAAHACGWFPDPPPVPEGEMVVSDFSDLGNIFQFPPSAWQLGSDGHLVRNYNVTFDTPSMPITGPLPVSGVVKREMRALMRQKEEVMRVLEEEGDMEMRGIDLDVTLGEPEDGNSDETMEDFKRPKRLGPEGTELYDGVSDYPEEWASHRSSGLFYQPTQDILVE